MLSIIAMIVILIILALYPIVMIKYFKGSKK